MGARDRHKPSETPGVQAAANDRTKNTTMLSSPKGDVTRKHNPDGTWSMKACVIGHCLFVPRMGSKTQNIQLGLGLGPGQ